jgi:hypothetical protein
MVEPRHLSRTSRHSSTPYVQAVNVIPWDKHLRDAANLDFKDLRRRTQLAYIDLAAEHAGGFADAVI